MLWLTPVARLRRILRWVTGDPSSPLADKRVLLTGASSDICKATRRRPSWCAPSTSSVMYRYDKQRPDSAAARGEPVS